MTTLKSALLGILPVTERAAPVNSATPGEKMFQSNTTARAAIGGVEGLKDVLKTMRAIHFKPNYREDRLYVYFNTPGEAAAAYRNYTANKALLGNLYVHQSSTTGFRIDKASTFVRGGKKVEEVQTFEQFVEGVKAAFGAFRAPYVSLTYKVDKVGNRVYAYAASQRKNGTAFEAAKTAVSATHKFHVVNKGEYTTTLRFDFAPKEVGNALLKGLVEVDARASEPAIPVKSTIYDRVATDPASKLEGLVPQETLEQVRRILAGERLPKPLYVPRFVTSGDTELKLFITSGKPLDLGKTIAELNQTAKDTAVFTYGQLGYAYFGSKTIHNPTVVIMRDYKNPKGAFVVVRVAGGDHYHMQIKSV